jgi:hypothetical protein
MERTENPLLGHVDSELNNFTVNSGSSVRQPAQNGSLVANKLFCVRISGEQTDDGGANDDQRG